jgi:imidazole glycerol-phosphate synthase subunit HisH
VSKSIAIIDYNVGNILNVVRAFKKIDFEVSVAETPSEISSKTDILVLPGVGAFGAGFAELESRGFVKTLNDFRNQNRPLMGICLGMQMLFEESLELGCHKGLGFLNGRIDRIPVQIIENKKYTVPNIGWSRMSAVNEQGKDLEKTVYFVHSFYVNGVDPKDLVTTSNYGKIQIPAIVKKNNIIGFQFHPEKSGIDGLELLERVVKSF